MSIKIQDNLLSSNNHRNDEFEERIDILNS